MMQITAVPRRQHERREDAERAIEIFYPGAGYCYEICPLVIQAGREQFHAYAVKVFKGEHKQFLGYAWDRDEEGLSL
jgi:hypothetical protein